MRQTTGIIARFDKSRLAHRQYKCREISRRTLSAKLYTFQLSNFEQLACENGLGIDRQPSSCHDHDLVISAIAGNNHAQFRHISAAKKI